MIADEAGPSVEVGDRLGTYEVQARLGSGGMGVVFRARDTRLGRDVAIKILPHAFTADPDRLSRFEREARVLASLNHQHIAAIYGLEESRGVKALVLELVEGETLADTLARRRPASGLPVAQALSIARQIADALDAAHEKGIAHRDLKPSNIALTRIGVVKLLDFGIAKIAEGGTFQSDLTDAPTAHVERTQDGLVIGTPAYMSPEQARGEPVDKRTDIWAFGCVVFEMLSGRAPFSGGSTADVLGEVLKSEPEWQRLPAETPESVRRLLRRCLRKERALRARDAGDVRLEIDEAIAHPEPTRSQEPQARRPGALVWLGAAAVALAAVLVGALTFRPAVIAPEARVEITTPPTADSSMALSPDGRKIVFVAETEGRSQLWLRTLDSVSARPLPGTERGSLPFWSPDSRSIGFFAQEKLKRLDVDTGAVRALAAAPAGLGGAWNRDGTILFSTNPGRPILRMPADGGQLSPVTKFDAPRQASQLFPWPLGDARHFLFFVTGSPEARGVYVGDIERPDTRRLFDADTAAVYSPDGYLFFVRGGQLLAQAIDAAASEPKGDPVVVADHVNARTVVSVSSTGTIAYRTAGPASDERNLRWMDRDGREIDRVDYADTSGIGPALSPDGRHVALMKYVNGNMDIWFYDRSRRTWDRVTSDSADDIFPLWSPDGTHMVFGSNRNASTMNLYTRAIDGQPGSEQLVLETPQPKFAMDWSSDGQTVLFNELNQKGDFDIWGLPMSGTRAPFVVVQTEFNEQQPQFSPDGKWLAYQSDKSGRFEIYVQPFPGPGGASTVSTEGGTQARWSRDGSELLYIAPDDRLMSVPIHVTPNGKAVEAGRPAALFTANGANAGDTHRHHYMVMPDGKSFVVNRMPEAGPSQPITLILNWKGKR